MLRYGLERGERALDLLRWGLIPHGCGDPDGGRKPINARAETVAQLPTFRAAYAKRRCIVPVDCFFEWRATKGARAKQPYAVAMKDRTPFAIAGLWENWRHPQSGEWIRTFVILTVPANELVAEIHDRMPLILPKVAYERWLGQEPDPHDLLVPFPADQMAMWPISTRVNKPENDDAIVARSGRVIPSPARSSRFGNLSQRPPPASFDALPARCKTSARPCSRQFWFGDRTAGTVGDRCARHPG